MLKGEAGDEALVASWNPANCMVASQRRGKYADVLPGYPCGRYDYDHITLSASVAETFVLPVPWQDQAVQLFPVYCTWNDLVFVGTYVGIGAKNGDPQLLRHLCQSFPDDICH